MRVPQPCPLRCVEHAHVAATLADAEYVLAWSHVDDSPPVRALGVELRAEIIAMRATVDRCATCRGAYLRLRLADPRAVFGLLSASELVNDLTGNSLAEYTDSPPPAGRS